MAKNFCGLVASSLFVVFITNEAATPHINLLYAPNKLTRNHTLVHGCIMFQIEGMVRGYHYYKDIWEVVIGEELECEREHGNIHDLYAVAVKQKSGVTVGHLPKKISSVCSLFLRRGGLIWCTVRGSRQYSSDLEQGGLEIPCTNYI